MTENNPLPANIMALIDEMAESNRKTPLSVIRLKVWKRKFEKQGYTFGLLGGVPYNVRKT